MVYTKAQTTPFCRNLAKQELRITDWNEMEALL